MLDNPIALLGLSILIAAIPIAVWLFITLKQGPSSKKIALMVFGFGCITAPALLGLQVVWEGRTAVIMALIPLLGLSIFIFDSYIKKTIAFILLILCVVSNYIASFQWIWSIKIPQFNLQSAIETNASSYITATILSLLLFVVMEENIKLYVMKVIDRKTLYISKINDAMIYAIAAALGFSFAENVYYLYSWWPSISNSELITMYIFRGIFTTAAHMTYSGIFGYYYGIGKFSMVINQQNLIEGNQDKISQYISKIFNIPPSEGFRQKTVLKGLFIAMGLHFSINFMLQAQQDYGIQILLPIVILANIAMFAFLQYLMNRKAGHLILLTDPSTKKISTMGKKDEDVVIELMNMWLKDQRYVDVIHICERLLERDPDNTVVKMFKAKAMDEMDEKNIYKKILGTVVKTDEDLSTDDKSIINKYASRNTETKEVKSIPKTPTQQTPPNTEEAPKKKLLEDLTGEGTFKL